MPGTRRNAASRVAARGLCPAGGGVVVGQGDDVEPGRRGCAMTSAGGLGAVGNIRVGMQVDPHRTSLVDRPATSADGGTVGLSRAAGETMGR